MTSQTVVRRSLHGTAGGFDRWTVGPLLIAALALLVAGIVLPALTVSTLAILSSSVSILNGLIVLWDDEQFFLFTVLFVFSVLFPAIKLLFGLWVWFGSRNPGAKTIGRMEALAKWSMLDVFVIALLVAALNVTVISGVFIHEGLYMFTASVLISKIVLGRIRKVALATA